MITLALSLLPNVFLRRCGDFWEQMDDVAIEIGKSGFSNPRENAAEASKQAKMGNFCLNLAESASMRRVPQKGAPENIPSASGKLLSVQRELSGRLRSGSVAKSCKMSLEAENQKILISTRFFEK